MTRFRNKIMWFWDSTDCTMRTVLVHRTYSNPWIVKLYFGTPECIQVNSLGEIIWNDKYCFESKVSNGASWNQLINRYFSKLKYNKCGEYYSYDTPDKL